MSLKVWCQTVLGGWLALLLSLPLAQPRAVGNAVLTLSEATLSNADGQPHTLPLPAQWRTGAVDRLHLHMQFDLEAQPEVLWAIRFDRLPPDHELRVNGQLAHGHAPDNSKWLPRSVISQWVDLPPSLLRAGTNHIELNVALHGRPGGVTMPRIGPESMLRLEHRMAVMVGESLPHLMNMAATGLALFMLLLWWLRRSEQLMGLFAGMMLLVSVRNMGYYVVDTGFTADIGSMVYFGAVITTNALIASMAMLAGPDSVRARHMSWLRRITIAILMVAVAGQLFGWLPQLRAFVYPFTLLVVAGSSWRLWHRARQLAPETQWRLLLAFIAILVCSVHDYLFQMAMLSVAGRLWLPYLTPVLMVVASHALLQRFVRVLDQSERHATELEHNVAERTRDLQLANAAKTRFVAAASHDLRQPVASIGLLASLLSEQVSDAGPRQVLRRLNDSVVALEGLLKGLLDLSRFDAGTVAVQRVLVPLDALFIAVAAHEGEAAAQKGLSLRLRSGGLAVQSDAVLLEQIVRNLVSNAVRYTERGGVLLSARQRGNDGVLLQVWDTGCGIPESQQRAVFEEFVQLDNPARERSRGLGLGLSLVKRAAERLGSHLSLRSVPGRGSCFSVDLAAARALPTGMQAAQITKPSLLGQRLLLVEDDAGVRESLQLRLESWGAQVQAWATVAELTQALQQGQVASRPGLLISDQRLPDGDSTDVVAVLAKHHAGVPVLVITGDTAPADLARLNALAWPVLHKPFGTEALFEAVLNATRREAHKA